MNFIGTYFVFNSAFKIFLKREVVGVLDLYQKGQHEMNAQKAGQNNAIKNLWREKHNLVFCIM